MAQIKEIRQRVRSVRSIEQITKAMKMVAGVKMRRAQDRILKARPYAYKLRELLSEVVQSVSAEGQPLLQRRDKGRTLLVVVAADKGLCGSFNTNIQRRAMQFFDRHAGEEIELVLVGRKSRSLTRSKKNVLREYPGIFRAVTYETAATIGDELIRRYQESGTRRVVVLYNEFKSASQQRVVEEQLLPLPPAAPGGKRKAEFLFEPDAVSLLQVLLPRSIKTQIYRILLESDSAEQAARLAAMDSATKNAGEMIRSLTMRLNRIRQAGITREILEVVSGAEALK